jgi:DNA-binding NtrC family response regulator
MARILIVEDDRITVLALERAVTQMEHTVVARTASAAEALATVHTHRPDVVLLDVHPSEAPHTLAVGRYLQAVWSTPVIVLSASDPAHLGLHDGPNALWGYLAKPIDWDQLQDLLARLFPTHRPRARESGLEDTPHPIYRAAPRAPDGDEPLQARPHRISPWTRSSPLRPPGLRKLWRHPSP